MEKSKLIVQCDGFEEDTLTAYREDKFIYIDACVKYDGGEDDETDIILNSKDARILANYILDMANRIDEESNDGYK